MLNKFTIQGRMVRDVELRRTTSGTAVASFTVAWSEKYKDTERKLFLPCVAWGNNAEFAAKWFEKGVELVAEGYLSSRSWQDRSGNKRETVELTVDRLHFCGGKREGGDATPASADFVEVGDDATPASADFVEVGDDGDLPF